jgi:dihydroneopterin aldolase
MKLKLNSLKVSCIIGDLPEERIREQVLSVDVSLTVPDRAAESDELADTVDYAVLARRISDALAAAKCRMIERAAKVVADVCLAEPLVEAAEVRVVKSGAVENLASAEAVLEARG